MALVIGHDAAPAAYLLAAHDVEVIFTGSDMTFVDQVESRISEEALGHYCTTYVVPTGQFATVLPERVHIVVIDTSTLEADNPSACRRFLDHVMERTALGGVHLILPSRHALAPDAFLSYYAEWTREDLPEDKRRPAKSLGLMLGKPPDLAEPKEQLRSRDLPA
jgi:hypothetical protein